MMKKLFSKIMVSTMLLFPFMIIAQTTHTVEVGPGMTYTPDVLTIEEGDIVTWTSEGGTHDVNFDINSQTGESFGNPDEIASASLPVQGAGEMGSITFDNAGTYNYDCSVGSHAAMGMVGMITVSELFTDCIIPEQYSAGSTGSNMTVMFTPDIVGAFPDNIVEDAYVVAVADNSGLVVGSVPIFGVNQTSLAVWGDDTSTPTVDGAAPNESITYYLVNGDELYDIDFTLWTMGDGLSYVTSGINAGGSANITFNCSTNSNITFGCTDETAFNYNASATDDDGSCEAIFVGCINDLYLEYNLEANVDTDPSSCITLIVQGCTDENAFNYNIQANVDDDSCVPFINGCTDQNAYNYVIEANTDDGSCYPVVPGCMDETAYNFNDYDYDFNANTLTGINGVDVNTDNGICIPVVYGCIDPTAYNFIAVSGDIYNDVNTDDGSCIAVLNGCTETWADNYNSEANTDDGSCDRLGCMSDWADNFDDIATTDDGSCDRLGCTSDWADNYDELATTDDGSCDRLGCMSDWADNYDELATTDNGSCDRLGCMSDWADNFDGLATTDDGSCLFTGCMEEGADNYDAQSNEPGYCQYLGCLDTSADNFDEQANEDDGSCLFTGCMNSEADNYNPQANVSGYCQFLGCTNLSSLNYDSAANEDDGSCIAVVQSCINPLAYNYNPNANEDDGSCLFNQNYIDSLNNYYTYFLNQYNSVVYASSILAAQLEIADPNSYGQIQLNLIPGWNTVGYNVIEPTDIVAQFEPIEEDLRLVKNNFGFIYWPQFGFNGIGDLIPGQGYQLRMDQSTTFHFVNTDQRRAISPTVPDWAIEMEAEVHPNDIRTLVKVVNMLGQEVHSNEVSSGTILLYLYNDGSVEKKIH